MGQLWKDNYPVRRIHGHRVRTEPENKPKVFMCSSALSIPFRAYLSLSLLFMVKVWNQWLSCANGPSLLKKMHLAV